MSVVFSGFTAITPRVRVDMVPLMRLLEGDKTAEVPEFERDAGIIALRAAGVPLWRICKAFSMSGTEIDNVLTGARTVSTVEEPVLPLKQRRMAERVLIDGRWVHPDAPHGSASGYDHWWCRCVPCSQARAVRAAEWRRMTAERKEARRGVHR